MRAVLLNMPRSVAGVVRSILSLLPPRVAHRVLVLGEGESYDFSVELDDAAISMLYKDQPTIMHHAGETLPGVTPPNGHRPGRPDEAREGAAAASAVSAPPGQPIASRAPAGDAMMAGLVRALQACAPMRACVPEAQR